MFIKNPEVGDKAEKSDFISQTPTNIKQFNYSKEELGSFSEMSGDDCNWNYKANPASLCCAAAKDQGVSYALPGSSMCQADSQ